MSENWWIAIAGFSLTVALAAMGGLIGWMFNVSSNVSAIAEDTKSLGVDSNHMREKFGEHTDYVRDKFDEHSNMLTDLRMDVTRLEQRVSTLPHP